VVVFEHGYCTRSYSFTYAPTQTAIGSGRVISLIFRLPLCLGCSDYTQQEIVNYMLSGTPLELQTRIRKYTYLISETIKDPDQEKVQKCIIL